MAWTGWLGAEKARQQVAKAFAARNLTRIHVSGWIHDFHRGVLNLAAVALMQSSHRVVRLGPHGNFIKLIHLRRRLRSVHLVMLWCAPIAPCIFEYVVAIGP